MISQPPLPPVPTTFEIQNDKTNDYSVHGTGHSMWSSGVMFIFSATSSRWGIVPISQVWTLSAHGTSPTGRSSIVSGSAAPFPQHQQPAEQEKNICCQPLQVCDFKLPWQRRELPYLGAIYIKLPRTSQQLPPEWEAGGRRGGDHICTHDNENPSSDLLILP